MTRFIFFLLMLVAVTLLSFLFTIKMDKTEASGPLLVGSPILVFNN